jgi:hypothetical protein
MSSKFLVSLSLCFNYDRTYRRQCKNDDECAARLLELNLRRADTEAKQA